MKNELDMLNQKYHNKKIHYKTIDKELLEKVMEMFQKGISYDSPDIYAINKNDAMVLEHFEFDSTNNSKSGSEYRKELARVDRSFKQIPPFKIGDNIFYDTIACTHDVGNYYKNFLDVYSKHYVEIENYKQNVLNIAKDIKNTIVGFFIEDVTCLGNLFESEDGIRCVDLLQTKQFLDIFDQCGDLEFVLFGYFNGSDQYLSFISKQSIYEYRKEEIDLTKINIIDFDPHVTGYSIEIPRQLIAEKEDDNID